MVRMTQRERKCSPEKAIQREKKRPLPGVGDHPYIGGNSKRMSVHDPERVREGQLNPEKERGGVPEEERDCGTGREVCQEEKRERDGREPKGGRVSTTQGWWCGNPEREEARDPQRDRVEERGGERGRGRERERCQPRSACGATKRERHTEVNPERKRQGQVDPE